MKSELISLGIDNTKIATLLDYMRMAPADLLPALSSRQPKELIVQGIKEVEELSGYISDAGIGGSLRFTPGLARGLEIYTGTVWEVFLTDGSITPSLGAGGRYDGIIGGFLDNGVEYPAVGMTFGLDVIYEALLQKTGAAAEAPVDFYIIPLGTQKQCLKLVTGFRSSGLKADLDMTGRKLKKSLDYANANRIPYVVILGENELSVGRAKLKDMSSGSEREIELDALVAAALQVSGGDKAKGINVHMSGNG